MMLCLSLSSFSGAFAANPNLGQNNIGNDDGGNGVLDYNNFSPASKIVYASVFDTELDLTGFSEHMSSFNDMLVFYKTHNINAVAVTTTKDNLKPGDIIQLENSDSAFLIYCGENSDGKILVEDLYYQFECTPETFDILFTGNAILINHETTLNTKDADANNIKDTPIYNNKKKIKAVKRDKSKVVNVLNTWNNLEKDPRIVNLAAKLKTSNSDYENLRNIFNWMRDNFDYDVHFDTIHTFTVTWDKKKGNCCEKSRIVVALSKAMGMDAKFFKVPNHVFSESYSKTKGRWVVIDTCYSSQKRFDKPEIANGYTPLNSIWF